MADFGPKWSNSDSQFNSFQPIGLKISQNIEERILRSRIPHLATSDFTIRNESNYSEKIEKFQYRSSAARKPPIDLAPLVMDSGSKVGKTFSRLPPPRNRIFERVVKNGQNFFRSVPKLVYGVNRARWVQIWNPFWDWKIASSNTRHAWVISSS